METREVLRKRPDVPNEDIDDIIGIAQELQTAAEQDAERATVAEVEAVASELQIDPAHVERAIEVLQTRRAEAASAAEARAAADAEQRASSRRTLLIGGGALVAALTVGGLVAAGVSASRGSADAAADATLARAEANLDVVLQRQAALVPQLLALSGGEVAGLESRVEAVTDGATMAERLDASDALGVELAKRLAALPPATDEATAQQRLSLQHELSGTQNRITVERRRYEEARLAAE